MIGPSFYQLGDAAGSEHESPFPGDHDTLLEAAAAIYARQPEALLRRKNQAHGSSSIADHLDHCLCHYRRFLEGVGTRRIDYGHGQLEERSSDRGDALAELADLRARLFREASHLPRMTPVLVREKCGPWLESTVGRESSVLAGHAAHHFLWIALILQNLQQPAPELFPFLSPEAAMSGVV